MTAQIFIAVVCLLALKYTLDLAGSTGRTRRRTPVTAVSVAAGARSRLSRLPRRWGWMLFAGVTLASIGAVSDRSSAPLFLFAGLALTQAAVFFAGVRWARRPRRRPTPARQARESAGEPHLALLT